MLLGENFMGDSHTATRQRTVHDVIMKQREGM